MQWINALLVSFSVFLSDAVDPIAIEAGQTMERRIEPTDSIVSTEYLEFYGLEVLPSRGKTFLFRPQTPGNFVVEATSDSIELHVVVRDPTHEIMGEDFQSLWGIFPRIVLRDLTVGRAYRIEVASRFGVPGPFQLRLHPATDQLVLSDPRLSSGLSIFKTKLQSLSEQSTPDLLTQGTIRVQYAKVLLNSVAGKSPPNRQEILDRAETLLKQALEFRRSSPGTHPLFAEVLRDLVRLFDMKADSIQAERTQREELSVRETLEARRSPDFAVGLSNLSLFLLRQSKLKEAETVARQAVTLWSEIQGQQNGNLAHSLSFLGTVLRSREKFEEAAKIHQQAIDMLTELSLTQGSAYAENMGNLAVALQNQGKYEEAEKRNRLALKLYLELVPQEHPVVLKCMNNLAAILESRGRYREAEEMHRNVLKGLKQIYSGTHPEIASSLNNLAVLHSKQGRPEEAEVAARRAVNIQKEIFGDHPFVVNSLNNLAASIAEQQRPAEARKTYEEALAILHRLPQDFDLLKARILNNLGELSQGQDKLEEAERLLVESLRLRSNESHSLQVANSLVNLGANQMARGKTDEAAKSFREALAINREFLGGLHPDIAVVLSKLGDSLYQVEQWEEAEQAYREATEIHEVHRTSTAGLEWERAKLSNRLEFRRTAASLADVLTRTGQIEGAVLASERSKGRAFLDLLARADSQYLPDFGKDSPNIRERIAAESKARSQRFEEDCALEAVLRLRGPDSPETRRQIKTVRRSELRLREATREVNKALYRVMPDAKPIDLNTIRRAIPKNDVLVSYTWSSEALILHLIPAEGQGNPVGRILVDGKENLRSFTRDWLNWAESLRNADSQVDHKLQTRLFNLLIPPSIRPRLRKADRIMISPDAPLQIAPFEVFPFFDEGPGISYVTSGSALLGADLAQKDLSSSQDGEQPRVMLVGDPVFKEHLPGTRVEVDRIADICRKSGLLTDILVEEEVTLSNIEARVRGVRVLHIATHGKAGSARRPEEAALFLSDPQEGTSEPQARLSLERLLRQWGGVLESCDLVVLSGCETKVDVEVGDSAMALPWGFFYAGSPTVVACLWQVDDGATALLMVRFYENLFGYFAGTRTVGGRSYPHGKGLPKAMALQEAKLWLKRRSAKENQRDLADVAFQTRNGSLTPGRNPRTRRLENRFDFSHPRFWAPFILLGNPD